jgi:hypothetical protein
VRALTRHRARQSAARLLLGAEYASIGLVFASTFGEPLWWANVVRRHFAPILARTALRLAKLELPSLAEFVANWRQAAEPAGPIGPKRAARRAWAKECAKVEEKALASTGLEQMRPYDLRHSAATLLLAAGEHPKVVAELLGHSKITLTLDTYSHVTPALLEQAARRMEDLVSAAPRQAALGARDLTLHDRAYNGPTENSPRKPIKRNRYWRSRIRT